VVEWWWGGGVRGEKASAVQPELECRQEACAGRARAAARLCRFAPTRYAQMNGVPYADKIGTMALAAVIRRRRICLFRKPVERPQGVKKRRAYAGVSEMRAKTAGMARARCRPGCVRENAACMVRQERARRVLPNAAAVSASRLRPPTHVGKKCPRPPRTRCARRGVTRRACAVAGGGGRMPGMLQRPRGWRRWLEVKAARGAPAKEEERRSEARQQTARVITEEYKRAGKGQPTAAPMRGIRYAIREPDKR